MIPETSGEQVEQISEDHENHALSWRGHGRRVPVSYSLSRGCRRLPVVFTWKRLLCQAARWLLMRVNRLEKKKMQLPVLTTKYKKKTL